jgi:hypothetical protein
MGGTGARGAIGMQSLLQAIIGRFDGLWRIEIKSHVDMRGGDNSLKA